ncbi:hypothetical protein AAFF_G00092130 [Aldrovandia affinis]|uniref:Uncharacterized protein n=1 Tax=Aldrovandia affinis TaxID=143900 RepID=A0AAD7WXV0_9TELE|nr:hypothetical protein AAFF_G00092130 [Aldrovandia affinis]
MSLSLQHQLDWKVTLSHQARTDILEATAATKVVFHNACRGICRKERGPGARSPAAAEGPKPQLSLFAESQRLARNAI